MAGRAVRDGELTFGGGRLGDFIDLLACRLLWPVAASNPPRAAQLAILAGEVFLNPIVILVSRHGSNPFMDGQPILPGEWNRCRVEEIDGTQAGNRRAKDAPRLWSGGARLSLMLEEDQKGIRTTPGTEAHSTAMRPY